ncbi:hypothetical protein ACJIZ3_025262 [Penstemon smallii]|uniref:Uncharacterized protein n=1 Tax=Penstemon smallii TaxID=265156 RepID=A0ABD3TVH1_9LAMI
MNFLLGAQPSMLFRILVCTQNESLTAIVK